jgi:TetR/AcrR family transcriptional regulator, transcriptional repressor for nem operon
MPRPKTYSPSKLIEDALLQFWLVGYNATSIDELVQATGSSRRALYDTYGGKRQLFLACFPHYQTSIVDPAFARVEQRGATLSDVADYFEAQILNAEDIGLPGPGCFVANAATETAPHDDDVRELVLAHNERLKGGFANVLAKMGDKLSAAEIDQLAMAFVIFTNGLWSMSRVIADATMLRAAVAQFLQQIEGAFGHGTN